MPEGLACDVCRRFFTYDEIKTNDNLNLYTVETKYDAKSNSIFVSVCSVDCLQQLEGGWLMMERWDFKTTTGVFPVYRIKREKNKGG